MKRGLVVLVKKEKFLSKKFLHGKSLYTNFLERLHSVQNIFNTIIIAAADDSKTVNYLKKVPSPFPVVYGDATKTTLRIHNAVKNLDLDWIAVAVVTQPLFNNAIVHDMAGYFEARYDKINVLFLDKYPCGMGCVMVRKEILPNIATQCPHVLDVAKWKDVPGIAKVCAYYPRYNEYLGDYPSDLKINNELDFKISSMVYAEIKNKNFHVSIEEFADILKQQTVMAPPLLKTLPVEERRLIQKKYLLPLEIYFEVIAYCILDCEYCVLRALQPWKYRRARSMSIEIFKKIIDQIAFFTTRIGLYGGEPLLHKDIFAMCAYARQKNISTTMVSNCQLLTEDNIKKMLASPPDELLVAYDALDKETYESTRKRGQFDVLKNNIVSLFELKQKTKSALPKICLQMVVTKKNMHMIEDFWKFAEAIGADSGSVKALGAWPEGSEAYNLHLESDYIVSRSEHYASRTDLVDGKAVEVRWPGDCASVLFPFIGSGGEVLPCNYISVSIDPLGNCDDEPFFTIWDSEQYRRFRKKMKTDWAHPVCHQCIGCASPPNGEIRIFNKGTEPLIRQLSHA